MSLFQQCGNETEKDLVLKNLTLYEKQKYKSETEKSRFRNVCILFKCFSRSTLLLLYKNSKSNGRYSNTDFEEYSDWKKYETWINIMRHLRVNWFKARREKIISNNKYFLIFEKNMQGVSSLIVITFIGSGTVQEGHWVEGIFNFYLCFSYIFVYFVYLLIHLNIRPHFIYVENNSIVVISSKDTLTKEKRNSKTWEDNVVTYPCDYYFLKEANINDEDLFWRFEMCELLL